VHRPKVTKVFCFFFPKKKILFSLLLTYTVIPAALMTQFAVLDPRRKRILYRATHRGTHETDILFGDYLAPRLQTMDDAALTAVERLIDLPDADLADWLSGRKPIPPQHDHPLLRQMRDHAIR